MSYYSLITSCATHGVIEIYPVQLHQTIKLLTALVICMASRWLEDQGQFFSKMESKRW